ncbi:MAG: hypothetical protein D6691_00025 [Candidatus Hydrogenedentota bacterium]|nr:MAG: hypothetical protein D6691_00025 [Candidatus Hydrogenedentota bacterium]
MIWRSWMCVAVVGCFLVCSGGVAQPSPTEQNEPQMPEIQAPRKPSPEEQTGLMAGNKPFSLTTDPDGEFVYKFNENNELETLEAKKGVIFTSEDMTLNADRLDYKAAKGELTATGKKVIVRQGELIITCQLFKYYPDRQHSEFLGNAVVYNRTKDGKVQTTAADKIVVDIVDGKAQMKVQGGGRVRPQMSQAATAPTAVSTPGSGGARAMIMEPQQAGNQGTAGVVDRGASQPVEPKTTGTAEPRVKLVPSVEGAVPSGTSKGSANTKSAAPAGKAIRPGDPSQMKALAGEKK